MQQSVEIESRGMILRGSLHIPDSFKPGSCENTGRLPIVIILHGFAGNKTGPHFIFVKLSRMLEKMGMASLRFDFAGSGESDGDFIDMTVLGELEDAKNMLDFARTLDFVDTDRISLVGLSMGGAVASMLASARKSNVHSLCLWAPAGNMGEIVVNNFIGAGYPEYERKGGYDIDGLTVGRKFVEEVAGLDIYQSAAGYDKRVLLIHGDKDEVVSIEASKKYLGYYGEKAGLKVVNGADHTFNRSEWEEQVLKATAEFLSTDVI